MPSTIAAPRLGARRRKLRPPGEAFVFALVWVTIMLADIVRAVVTLTESLHPLDGFNVAGAVLLFSVSAYMFALIYRHLGWLRHVRGVRMPRTAWIQAFVLGLVAAWMWIPGSTG